MKKNKIIAFLLIALIAVGGIFSSTDEAFAASYCKTSYNVKLRASASTYSKALCTIPAKTTLPYYGSYNGFGKVVYKGKTGWVLKKYLYNFTNSNNSTKSNYSTSNYSTQTINLIKVNTRSNILTVYSGGKAIRSFYCATGKKSTPTPKGTFYIINKQVNRPYYSKGIPGGSPYNPLGTRWMGIGRSYGIHGTNNPGSIGYHVSNGCIRLNNSAVEWVYPRTPLYTRVIII